MSAPASVIPCPDCGAQNDARARGCGTCGADWAESTGKHSRPPELDLTLHRPEAEEDIGLSKTHERASVILEGKWLLLEELGRGGMGRVHLAQDLKLERVVAVKLLSPALKEIPELVQRFEREARLLAKLDHPNLVPVYNVGVDPEGLPFIVMKRLEGESLHDRLSARGPCSPKEALEIFRQACAGLQFLHDRGVVHRDLKPSNLFLAPGGHVTLLDLGVATDFSDSLTRTGVPLGTPAYMSPEQIVRAALVDHRADLYSLTCVLYEMLAGAAPFSADSDYALMQAHVREPAPDVRKLRADLPPAISDVLKRGLAKSPEQRFQSARELFAALEAAVEHPEKRQPVPSSAGGLGARKANLGWLTWAGAAVVLLGCGVGAVLVFRPAPAPPPAINLAKTEAEPKPVVVAPVVVPEEPLPKETPERVEEPAPEKKTPVKKAAAKKPAEPIDVRFSAVRGTDRVKPELEVDGNRIGYLPTSVSLKPGPHTAVLRFSDGHPPFTYRFEVKPGLDKHVIQVP